MIVNIVGKTGANSLAFLKACSGGSNLAFDKRGKRIRNNYISQLEAPHFILHCCCQGFITQL